MSEFNSSMNSNVELKAFAGRTIETLATNYHERRVANPLKNGPPLEYVSPPTDKIVRELIAFDPPQESRILKVGNGKHVEVEN